jgi:UDP-N-acetylmuramyl pentapeptide synthase
MKELGSETEEAHRQLGRAVAETAPEAVFFFGEETNAALEELRMAGFSGQSAAYTAYEELERAVVESVETGDTVLLKGSRSMELERLIQPIRKMTEQKGSAQQSAGGSA